MPRKILLADDSVTAQNMGRRILSEAGYEVVTVNNGPAALKKLAEQKPDLVILDIYMPGYGGMEVCQKIKENPETSSLPVLLTVGKLEPFKADEARRVRADAHLVKPFEATELLAALIKLEDKIVPRDGGRAPAKAAKGKAANQTAAPAKDKKFGDTESGWKSRLTIPPPEAKRPQPVEEETPGTAFREFARKEDQAATEETPAGGGAFSQDITAEEIAAITAAAAAFGNNAGQEGEISEPAVTEEEIVAAVSYMPVPDEVAPEPQTEAEAAIDLSALPDTAFFTEADLPAEEKAAEDKEEKIEQAASAANAEVDAVEAPPVPDVATDEEVAAMLAALAPLPGSDAGAGIPSGNGLGAKVSAAEPAFAEVGSSWRSFASTGARWIAEEVTVSASEASLILEQEMEKAYTAMAEFLPAAGSGAGGAEFVQGYGGAPESAGAEIYEARAEETPSPATGELNTQAVSCQEVEPAPAAEAAVATGYSDAAPAEINAPPEPVAENIGMEEPSTDSTGAVAMTESYETVQAESTQSVEAAADSAEVSQEKSAYAAAAGTEFHSINHVEVPTPETPAELAPSAEPTAPAEVNNEHEAELAAAWAHWRQIRETIANPQFTSQVADAAAAGYKDIHPPAAVVPEASDGPSAEEVTATAADPAAIASIVDSVLAELKPKLVAEIARKLGKEKK